MISHDESRTQLCVLCGKAFKTKGNLKQHMISHDESTQLCTLCGKVFKAKRNLKVHMISHDEICQMIKRDQVTMTSGHAKYLIQTFMMCYN